MTYLRVKCDFKMRFNQNVFSHNSWAYILKYSIVDPEVTQDSLYET